MGQGIENCQEGFRRSCLPPPLPLSVISACLRWASRHTRSLYPEMLSLQEGHLHPWEYESASGLGEDSRFHLVSSIQPADASKWWKGQLFSSVIILPVCHGIHHMCVLCKQRISAWMLCNCVQFLSMGCCGEGRVVLNSLMIVFSVCTVRNVFSALRWRSKIEASGYNP